MPPLGIIGTTDEVGLWLIPFVVFEGKGVR